MRTQENDSNSFPLQNALQNIVGKMQPQPTKPNDTKVAQFIRPTIDYVATMKNFRAFYDAYNIRVEKLNQDRERYNRKVKAYKNENKPTAEIVSKLKDFATNYQGENNGHTYNALVDAFNNTYGFWLNKRKIQTLKIQAIEIFAAMLHEYSCDLHFRNSTRDRLKVFVPGELPKMEINPNNIIKQTRNGHKNINVCTRTIRNQRQRLEEAEVLINYTFKSHRRPIEVDVNNEILTVFEAFNPQKRTTENQQVTPEKGKNFPHANVSTRTLLNKNKKKGNVKNISQEKEFAIAHNPIIFFYKNTQSQDVENFKAPAKKNKPPAQNLTEKQAQSFEHSENLRDQIDLTFDLAEKLANGDYDYYTPIDIRRLEYEAATGNMSPEEFTEFAIQDFMKTAAKLWRNNNAAPGSWYNAIEIWKNEKFRTFTGAPFNKTTVIERLKEYRYRINYAYKWFEKNKWEGVHYPNIYFNPTRKMPEDVCFEYTAKAAKQLIEKRKKAASEKKMRSAAAKRREEQYKLERKHNRLLDQAVRKYLKKGYKLDDLINYTKKNLPVNYLQKLPVRLEQLTLKTFK